MNEVKKAPWKDFSGVDIFAGSVLEHPASRQAGIVKYYPERETEHDQWVVKYFDGVESRLSLQVGEKGMGVVKYNG